MSGFLHRRLLCAGALFLLAFSSPLRNYCPMPASASPVEQATACHGAAADQSVAVFAGRTPDCCHSEWKGQPPATRPAPESVALPAAAAHMPVGIELASALGPVVVARAAGHGPPVTVLRV